MPSGTPNPGRGRVWQGTSGCQCDKREDRDACCLVRLPAWLPSARCTSRDSIESKNRSFRASSFGFLGAISNTGPSGTTSMDLRRWCLYALLPDLGPVPSDEWRIHSSRPSESRVLVIWLVKPGGDRSGQEFFEHKLRELAKISADPEPEVSGHPPGLTKYSFKAWRRTGLLLEDLYTYDFGEGRRLNISCPVLGQFPNPICDGWWRLEAGIVLSYRFREVYLPEWRQIHERTVALVDSFRTEPRPGSARP